MRTFFFPSLFVYLCSGNLLWQGIDRFKCLRWTTQKGWWGWGLILGVSYLSKHRELVSITRSHSDQKFYPRHENISTWEGQNWWSCKDLVLMNLPFPIKRNHFSTSFWAGIGKDSTMHERSQMNWHVPFGSISEVRWDVAEHQIQCCIGCSAGALWIHFHYLWCPEGCVAQQEAYVHGSLAENMKQGFKLLREHFRLLFASFSVAFLKRKTDF